MRTLVFWGDAPLPAAKARAAEGARVLLWGRPGAVADAELTTADFPPEAAARIENAVKEWASAFGELPGAGARRFADLFAWNEEPLWPLLHRFLLSPESASGRCVRLVESFSVAFEAELPDEVEAVGLGEDELTLLQRGCTARGVLFQGESKRRATRAVPKAANLGLRDRIRGFWTAGGGGGAKAAPGALVFVRPETATAELAEAFERLVHVAREEMALVSIVLGGQGEPEPETLQDAAARAAVADAEAGLARAFAELKDAPSTSAAFIHEGVSFADLAAEADLSALLKRVLPKAVRRAEGVRAVLRARKPKALCAAAEDTLVLRAARVEGTPALPFAEAKDGPRMLLALERAARGAGMVG